MMFSVLLVTVVGSFVVSLMPSGTMGNFSVFMTFMLGIAIMGVNPFGEKNKKQELPGENAREFLLFYPEKAWGI